MIGIIVLLWMISIFFILIFFKGATRKEREVEYSTKLLLNKKEKN